MKKIFNTWSILLIAAGLLGLAVLQGEKIIEAKKLQPYKEMFSDGTDTFFAKFEKYLTTANNQEMTSEMLVEYGKKQKELTENQNNMLMADLDTLSSGEKQPCVLADMKYGSTWQETVESHRKKEGLLEFSQISAIVSFAAGFVIAAWTAVASIMSGITAKRARKKTEDKRLKLTQEAQFKPIEQIIPDIKPVTDEAKIESENTPDKTQETPIEISAAQTQDSSTQSDDPESGEEQTNKETATSQFGKYNKSRLHEAGLTSIKFGAETANALTPITQKSNMMSTAPVNKSISDLSEQVSAIRQFATQQQDRVRQLQDGYDWSIIKRFCIRIIRCIDNLNGRIENENNNGIKPETLEDIRDELIFALESSGVEQFSPPLESEYKGIEKYAEALHKREYTDNEKLTGRIAKVTRPGYQYVVSEEEVKIVRCAQVILYGHQITDTVGV
ncbi:MAG: hypothetical protein KAS23_01330 [Anaerohalosphaera sp.]|nr:hypothetical protein [Anaerohalosphaera sp.]